MKKAFLIVVAVLVAFAGMYWMNGLWDYTHQKTFEEERAETLSHLYPQDIYNFWQQVPLEKRKAELLSMLQSKDVYTPLFSQLQAEHIYSPLKEAKNSYYDQSYFFVDQALGGKELNEILTPRMRITGLKVEIEIKEGEEIIEQDVFHENYSLAYIYSEDYVVLLTNLFIYQLPTLSGATWFVPLFEYLDVVEKGFEEANPGMEMTFTTTLTMMANPIFEDDWKFEELGEVEVYYEKGLAIAERMDPVLGLPEEEYAMGSFDKLAVGDKLYYLGAAFGEFYPNEGSVIRKLNLPETNFNFILFQGTITPLEYGGLVFSLKDGFPELVGLVIEPLMGETKGVAVNIAKIKEFVEENTK